MGVGEFHGGRGTPDPLLISSLDMANGSGMSDIPREESLFIGMDPLKGKAMFREKLRTNQVKKCDDSARKGPLIACHPLTSQLGVAEPVGSTPKEVEGRRVVHTRSSRTPSPSAAKRHQLLSPKEKVGLQRSRSHVDLQRRRSPSAPRSRPASPGSIRGPSPAGSLDNLYVETVLKRVQKVQKARLYLLQQLGPHCFVVGGDSPEHKFKIMIGPQTCTCGRGPHCVHILFVMLRVFQISENDPRLWSKQLKNFEVESLFSRYEEQRRSRVKMTGTSKAKLTDGGTEVTQSQAVDSIASAEQVGNLKSCSVSSINSHDEGEKCVICLLEMVDCESLVYCTNGCRNKYHLHCVTIWAEYCRRQQIQLSCPLCRTLWDVSSDISGNKSLSQSSDGDRHDLSSITLSSSSSSSISGTSSSVDSAVGLESPPAAVHQEQPCFGDNSYKDLHLYSSTPLPAVESFPPLLIDSSAKQLHTAIVPSVAKSSQLQHGLGPVQGWTSSSYGIVRVGHASRNPAYISLPRCHSVVPKEFARVAPVWAEVFGVDMVTCIFSRDWKTKVLALRRLSQEIVEWLSTLSGRSQSLHVSDDDIVKYCCQILTMMACNPVYKVYLACLQCLKTLLAYVPIKTEDNLVTLQDVVKPVILAVLPRCCDGTKPGELSLSMLVELCKCHNGELAVGQHTPYPSESGMGGVGYVLKCVFDGMREKEPRSWQWLLGRLVLLDKVMVEFPQDFHLVLVPPPFVSNKYPAEWDTDSTSMVPIASRYQRLVTIWRFALAALKVQHTNVVKQAREVLLTSVRFAATVPAVLQQVCTSAAVDPILEQRLSAWVRDELQDYLSKLSFTADGNDGHPQNGVGCCASNVRVALGASTPPGHPCHRRRHHLVHHEQPNNSCGAHEQTSHWPDVKAAFSTQPHLPSCGGISPTKGLDHSYVSRKFGVLASGGSNSECGSPLSCNGGGASPCTSATSSPSALRRRLPGLSSACVSATSRLTQHPSTPSRADGCLWNSGRSSCEPRNQPSSSSSHKRPNYLPLQGTFRDAVDWDKFNRAPSPPRFKHRSPPPPPLRFERRQKTTTADRDFGYEGRNSGGGQSFGSCRRSSSSSGVAAAAAAAVATVNHLNGGRNNRVCCDREAVTAPAIRSQRRTADVRPSSRLCSKKLDGVLGPILPSLPSQGKGPPICSGKVATSPMQRKDSLLSVASSPTASQPPPAPPSSPEGEALSFDSNVCKLKHDVELEEAVALAMAMENSAHHVEIPDIPGLMQYDDDQELIIHEEPDELDEDPKKLESYLYVEGVHWQKGPILGTGAFSTCYQARDIQTGTLMAMKQVSFCRNSPDEQDKVMNSIKEEIALMARLNHPHIVRILGATQQRNHFNMFVEWMPGGSVSNLLDKYGAFTEPVIISYTQQVLSGLAYLHDNQVLHRDLKGANLLVDSTGHYLRIGDFGAAARLASRSTVAGEFQGQLLGTIAFMAPEVLRGDDYGRSCDIWSVGCVLIEMASTKPPWNADDVSNHLALIYKIARAQDPPPIPDRLSPATRDLALRCLEVKSDDRPPAKELLKHPVFRMSFA